MPKAVRVVVIGLRSVTESPRAQVSCPNSSEWMISMFIAWPHGVGCRAFLWAVLSVLIPKKLLTGSARNMEQKLASTRGRHVALHRSRAKHRLPHKCQSKDGGILQTAVGGRAVSPRKRLKSDPLNVRM